MSLTMGEINQLSIDLAFLQAQIKTCVDKQKVQFLFAFGVYDAPSDKVEKESAENYWALEKDIQNALKKVQKIKEKLR